MVSHEKGPVHQMAHADPACGKVSGGMAQQKQGLKGGRRSENRNPGNRNRFSGTCGKMFEQGFQPAIRGMCPGIEKIIMVLNGNIIQPEGRMVLLPRIDGNPPLPGQQGIGFGLSSEEPDVDIAARPVFGNGIVETQAVSLEQQHPDSMPGIEGGQSGHATALSFPALFDSFGFEGPAQSQGRGGLQRGGNPPDSLPDQSRDPLPPCKPEKPLPHGGITGCQTAELFCGVSQRPS